MTIDDLNNRTDLTLVTDSQEVREIHAFLTPQENKEAKGVTGFFVRIENGEYAEVYGFAGTVPYFDREVYRIR